VGGIAREDGGDLHEEEPLPDHPRTGGAAGGDGVSAVGWGQSSEVVKRKDLIEKIPLGLLLSLSLLFGCDMHSDKTYYEPKNSEDLIRQVAEFSSLRISGDAELVAISISAWQDSDIEYLFKCNGVDPCVKTTNSASTALQIGSQDDLEKALKKYSYYFKNFSVSGIPTRSYGEPAKEAKGYCYIENIETTTNIYTLVSIITDNLKVKVAE
jgi:hypothetical protein